MHAANISEVDVSDRDNLKVTQPYDGRMVTLLLGDRNFAAALSEFPESLCARSSSGCPDAATLDLRLEDRITVVE